MCHTHTETGIALPHGGVCTTFQSLTLLTTGGAARSSSRTGSRSAENLGTVSEGMVGDSPESRCFQ